MTTSTGNSTNIDMGFTFYDIEYPLKSNYFKEQSSSSSFLFTQVDNKGTQQASPKTWNYPA